MRRHGPVIAHCTDSEDFPSLVQLQYQYCDINHPENCKILG